MIAPFESLGTISYSHDPILYFFRDKARYWSKVVIFFICPLCIRRPRVTRVPIGILPQRLVRKNRMVWLPDGEKFDVMYSHFDITPACDVQTDRQTDGHLATA